METFILEGRTYTGPVRACVHAGCGLKANVTLSIKDDVEHYADILLCPTHAWHMVCSGTYTALDLDGYDPNDGVLEVEDL